MAISHSALLLLLPVTIVSASPQYGPGGGFGGGNSGGPPGSDGAPGSGGPGNNDFGFGSASAFQSVSHVLVAHAVLAVLAWALFMPVGAIILRLNIQSPHLLKIHAFCQVSAYLIYIVAAGMGVYIIRESSPHEDLWHYAHPFIGLAILAVALFQPVWGLIHHGIFKRKMTDWRTGRSKSKPGRSAWGRLHLWIGRVLITLAMVNGGLGIQLAGTSPFQSAATTRRAEIAYGVLVGLMWIVYATISISFELNRSRRERRERGEQAAFLMKPANRNPPSYEQSTESL